MSTASDRIALVTGANRGIGLETVRQLAAQGIYTLLAARTLEKAKAAAAPLIAAGLPVDPVALDVTDPAAVRHLADAVRARHGRLDILVNNAAIMLNERTQPATKSSADAFRQTFETNVFALIDVTLAFLPLLQESDAGRIVNVSSNLGSLTNHSDPDSNIYDTFVTAYSASKTAVNAWTVQLAKSLRDTPVKVNSIHPGWVKTDMGGDAAPLTLEEGARTSVELATCDADGPSGGFFHAGKRLPW